MSVTATSRHLRVINGPDSLDTCTSCDWESWDSAPMFADHRGET